MVTLDGLGCNDCASLTYLNDTSLLDNVCYRYRSDEIYTYVAHVLLAVNPYKELLGVYGPAAIAKYRHAPRCGKRLPPHPYAIVEAALRGLCRLDPKGEARGHAIVISGESGAGKTETAKAIMRYVTAVVPDSTALQEDLVEGRLLSMSRIFESFGNAATLRNKNSSRFGKYVRLYPQSKRLLAQTETFLLEVSRVVAQSPGERSFHIFYEILAGLDASTLSLLGLVTNEFAWLRIDSHDADSDSFKKLCEAMKSLGMHDKLEGILEILAAVLHLGNVLNDEVASCDIDDDPEVSRDIRNHVLTQIASHLGVECDALRGMLLTRRVAVPGRKSFYTVPRSRAQVKSVMRSVAVTCYGRLFKWLCGEMNRILSARESEEASSFMAASAELGLLDIYGFESLTDNRLEQFLINLTNERLQQLFVDHALVAEQQIHIREGIPYRELEFDAGKDVVTIVSSALDVLDDFGSQRWRGLSVTDSHLYDAIIHRTAVASDLLSPVRFSSTRVARASSSQFSVRHYTGCVVYTVDSWLERNDAQPLTEVLDLLEESSKPLVRALAPAFTGEVASRKYRSVARIYRHDLKELLARLGRSHLHFVRCFLPNSCASPNQLDRDLLSMQLRNSGTHHLLQVMHQGYPHRIGIDYIAERFITEHSANFCPRLVQYAKRSQRTFIHMLLLSFGVPSDQWALGVTQLFLKAGQIGTLHELCSCGSWPDASALANASRVIVRGRWRRATLAISFALWLPKHLRILRQRRSLLRRRFRATVSTILFLRYLSRLASERKQWRMLQERRMVVRRRLRVAIIVVSTSQYLARLASKRHAVESLCFFTLETNFNDATDMSPNPRCQEIRRKAICY